MNNAKRAGWLSATIAALVAVGLAGTARASSHREAPAISNDPAADNTDLWAWVNGSHDTLYVVASYIPMEEPSGGPNFHKFSDDVLYEIHVTKPGVPNGQGGATYTLDDQATYQIRFHTADLGYTPDTNTTPVPGGGVEFFSQLTNYHNQSYTVTKVDAAGNATDLTPNGGLRVAPPNIGPRTNAVAYGLSGAYDDAFAATFIGTLTDGTSAWAGPRDDGFYVDLGGVFDLANLRAKGTAQDGVAGFNCHTIALAIPVASLLGGAVPHDGTPGDDSTVGVWASASRKKVRILRNDGSESSYGPWTQVSRLGIPLVNEALIGLQDKDKYNRTSPKTDVDNFAAYFTVPTVVRDAEAVGIYAALGVPQGTVDALKGPRLDILQTINLDNIPTTGAHHIAIAPGATGDVLRVDLAIDSGFPNGRRVGGGAAANQEQADVTDVLLSVILAQGSLTVSDGVDYNDKPYLTSFPFLALPWEGYSQGHGKTTP